MGNISQQATLCFNKRFDSVCHSVEASSESANFIAPPQNEIVAARSKLAVRDSSCHVTEPGHRSSDAPSKHPTKDSPDEQNHKEAGERRKTESFEQRNKRNMRQNEKDRVFAAAWACRLLSRKCAVANSR